MSRSLRSLANNIARDKNVNENTTVCSLTRYARSLSITPHVQREWDEGIGVGVHNVYWYHRGAAPAVLKWSGQEVGVVPLAS